MSNFNMGATARSRALPHFAPRFAPRTQTCWSTLFDRLGLKPEHEARVFTTFEMPGTFIGWRGHKGQWYKHPLTDGVAGLDDEELTALKMKVMMSTC